MSISRALRIAAAVSLAAAIVTPSFAESIREKTERKEADIPTCGRNLGTIAIREPEHNWWTDLNLASPEVLLKVFVRKSGCFTLVDRGKGFEMAQQERALASGGSLQQGSNVGAGQVKAADYILVPDIASKNADAGGMNIGGLLGGFVGHGAGAILGNLNLHSSTADVVLSIVNVRTSEDGPIEQGHGSKTDLGFGVGGGWGSWAGFGGAGVSSYTSTDIGQVVTLAYIDAYTKLVNDMGGMPGAGGASAEAPSQAVTMTRPGRMYSTSSPNSKVVRPLSAGMMLYPTGNKDGAMWEVKDELGNQGWVSSLSFELSK
ncbi:MAG TPA: CsgG/HfaB family protein [Rhizomicrobium sp.]|nr:CsgG/HfaB family protein [Rhizomicrobium sp.]